MPTELDACIDYLNRRYAVVNENGKVLIFRPVYDHILRRMVLQRMTCEDFKKLYANCPITVNVGKHNVTKTAAEWWLQDLRSVVYREGVIFDPTGTVHEGCWNLWREWPTKPRPGDWSLMRAHIREIICSNDEVLFEYIVGWLARMFQQPDRPGEVAIVLRGQKGCGKGTLGNWIQRAWGQHGIHIANSKHLVGNFNLHLRDAVFLFADEAFYAADKQHEGVLKALITEPTIFIEAKYQNAFMVLNMLHILMASNSDWVVPASHDERRYCVVDVSNAKVGDREYFAALNAQMENGGLAAMIYDLLNLDISDFNHRDAPITVALKEQKVHSFDTLRRWWHDVLKREYVFRSRFGLNEFSCWPEFAATELLVRSYLQWANENNINRPMTREQLGQMIKGMYQPTRPSGLQPIGEVQSASGSGGVVDFRKRPPGYTLGALDEARAAFECLIGMGLPWEDG